jgi:hypothetical protein
MVRMMRYVLQMAGPDWAVALMQGQPLVLSGGYGRSMYHDVAARHALWRSGA